MSEEKMKLDMYLENKGIEKQECPECGKKSYTGLHLCEPIANQQEDTNE